MAKWIENLKVSNAYTAFVVGDPLIRTDHIATICLWGT